MGLLKRLIVVKNFVMVPVLVLCVVFESGEVSSEKVAVAPLGLARVGDSLVS